MCFSVSLLMKLRIKEVESSPRETDWITLKMQGIRDRLYMFYWPLPLLEVEFIGLVMFRFADTGFIWALTGASWAEPCWCGMGRARPTPPPVGWNISSWHFICWWEAIKQLHGKYYCLQSAVDDKNPSEGSSFVYSRGTTNLVSSEVELKYRANRLH